jgi:hypothetical protein
LKGVSASAQQKRLTATGVPLRPLGAPLERKADDDSNADSADVLVIYTTATRPSIRVPAMLLRCFRSVFHRLQVGICFVPTLFLSVSLQCLAFGKSNLGCTFR